MCGYVLDAGRRVIAGDEVLDGQVDPAVTIQCWHDGERAAEALRRGHGLIASPAPLTYFDHDQVLGPTWPVSTGGPVTLEDLTALSPLLTDLSAQAGAGGPSGRRAGRLLGAQVQLWPRTSSAAAQMWTGSADGVGSYDALGGHLERLTALEVA